jgi:hypothetical protein
MDTVKDDAMTRQMFPTKSIHRSAVRATFADQCKRAVRPNQVGGVDTGRRGRCHREARQS